MGIVKLIGWVLLVSHASACIWLSIPLLENPNSEHNTWLSNSNEDYTNLNNQSKYLVAFYWAMTTLTTVGFGDIVPHSNFERIFSLFTMVLGVTFYAYSTATVSSVLHSLDLRETKNREKMESLRAFMKGVGLPYELTKKLNEHFRYAWWHQHSVFDSQSLMDSMPSHLRTEVAMVLYNDLIGKTAFFHGKSCQFIATVVTNIHPIKYCAKDYVGVTGENVQDWYITKSGVFECLLEQTENVLMTFVNGSTFGEIGILLTKKWVIDIRAATDCEVLAMSRRTMFRVFSEYPEARQDLVTITKERLKRLTLKIKECGITNNNILEEKTSFFRTSHVETGFQEVNLIGDKNNGKNISQEEASGLLKISGQINDIERSCGSLKNKLNKITNKLKTLNLEMQ